MSSASRWIGVRLYDGPNLKLFILVRWDQSSFFCCWSTKAQLMIFFCFRFPAILFGRPGHNTLYLWSSVESSSLLLHSIKLHRGDTFIHPLEGYMRTEQPTKCFVPLQKLRVKLCTKHPPPCISLLTVPML